MTDQRSLIAPFLRLFDANIVGMHQIKLGRPQASSMVEYFNDRINKVLATRRYTSGEDLEQTLKLFA